MVRQLLPSHQPKEDAGGIHEGPEAFGRDGRKSEEISSRFLRLGQFAVVPLPLHRGGRAKYVDG